MVEREPRRRATTSTATRSTTTSRPSPRAAPPTRKPARRSATAAARARLTDNPDRRTFHGAILDCRALDQEYNISGGSAPPLPVTAYAKFFLSEPMDKNDGTIWVELVDVVEPGTPAAKEILRETVQLYR